MTGNHNTRPAPARHASKRSRSGLTLAELLTVMAIVAALIALLMPAVRSTKEASRRSRCANNLKQIGIALHNYHDDYGGFPSAYTFDANGQPLHSWRTLILPYINQQAVYETIDLSKPWNHPVNLNAGEVMIPTYHCFDVDYPETHTAYLALVGMNNGLHPTQSRRLSEVKNGTSNTLIVVEVASQDAVHWMSPLDADEELVLSFAPKSGLPHHNGTQALYMDGTVRRLDAESPAAEWRSQLRISEDDK